MFESVGNMLKYSREELLPLPWQRHQKCIETPVPGVFGALFPTHAERGMCFDSKKSKNSQGMITLH